MGIFFFFMFSLFFIGYWFYSKYIKVGNNYLFSYLCFSCDLLGKNFLHEFVNGWIITNQRSGVGIGAIQKVHGENFHNFVNAGRSILLDLPPTLFIMTENFTVAASGEKNPHQGQKSDVFVCFYDWTILLTLPSPMPHVTLNQYSKKLSKIDFISDKNNSSQL